ncbi:hypothetical protein HER39_01825 [Arthrobacter deserti]|uniref:Uncharacterized protein n=1 Tax=Arthrobacter deserti TaxID=1742687 RepID=A0ABX1JJN0_9MICC|nr:hypothetical protein [Arthrobacter deserti]
METASVTADGLLVLAGGLGQAPEEGPDQAGCAFIVVQRRSKVEMEFPASLAQAPDGGTAVTCTIPLAELQAAADELLDLYFQVRGPSGTARTRVAWQKQGVDWLPYPTKFGNLSFKRRGS